MSKKIEDGGPAFPNPIRLRNGRVGHPGEQTIETEGGMSLRDYFAGQAIIGILTGSATLVAARGSEPLKDTVNAFSQSVYEIADAMLKARSNDNG